ncbi:ATP-binding protein [Streptomyces sp. Ac-502]|uniref:ATP-binding protein n=1 Tax=Streptomyces sp. Ac-502 TaxID=3342801 RepID=UPI0038623FCD
MTDLMTLTGNTELVDDIRVLVSELVTNVHLHTDTAVVRLDVTVHPTSVRVAVWDDAPRSRLLSLPALLDDGSGRGLHLVEALASRWGVYRPNIDTRRRKGCGSRSTGAEASCRKAEAVGAPADMAKMA